MKVRFIWLLKRLSIMSYKEIVFYRVPRLLKMLISYFFSPKIKRLILREECSFKFRDDFIDDFNLYNYSFFDVSLVLNEIKEWNYDYKNNIASENKFYLFINRQNIEEYGDVKYVSELSRFHFLPFFALKWRRTKDERYINFISHSIDSWNKSNPYLWSINWTSGIEVAIRAINTVFTYLILEDNNQLRDKLRNLLEKSYHFLKNHLSLYSSANNHLIAELSALNILSVIFTNDDIVAESNKWKRMFFSEILKQINKDGVSMELSTRYHAEVLDYITNTFVFLKKAHVIIPKEIFDRLRGSAQFLLHVSYNDNKVEFGDNDEGYVINPYFEKDFEYYISIYNSIKFLLGEGIISNLDARNKLLFADSRLKFSKESTLIKDQIFSDSGYLFLYDHSNKTKFSFDFGMIGDHINAAHGHSDIFHFNLESNGLKYLVDSGTFQYHRKFSEWRDYFRSSAAHNTISINQNFHGTIGGRMLWLTQPEKPEVLDYRRTGNIYFSSRVRLNGATWEREFTLDKTKKEILICDKIFPEERVNIFYFLQFNPLIQEISSGKNSIRLHKDESNYLDIEFNFKDFEIFNGNKDDRIIGWNSECFGTKQESKVLFYHCVTKETKIIETKISYINT